MNHKMQLCISALLSTATIIVRQSHQIVWLIVAVQNLQFKYYLELVNYSHYIHTTLLFNLHNLRLSKSLCLPHRQMAIQVVCILLQHHCHPMSYHTLWQIHCYSTPPLGLLCQLVHQRDECLHHHNHLQKQSISTTYQDHTSITIDFVKKMYHSVDEIFCHTT